ncbi:MAG: hypothetical protein QM778_18675 [Myxococcales bacterium]
MRFTSVDEAECRCLGRRHGHFVQGDFFYQHCEVVDTERVRRDPVHDFLLDSLDIPAFGIGPLHQIRKGRVLLRVLPDLLPQALGSPTSFALRSLSMVDSRVGSRDEPPLLEVTYRVMPAMDLERLVTLVSHDDSPGLLAFPATDDRNPSIRLAWNGGTGDRQTYIPEDSRVARTVHDELQRSPSLSSCTAGARLPYGGAACVPGIRDAPYLAWRRGNMEIRAVTRVVADALCEGLAQVLSTRPGLLKAPVDLPRSEPRRSGPKKKSEAKPKLDDPLIGL